MRQLPSIEQVRNHLSYDPDTGEFTWLVQRRNKALVGSRAGRTLKSGYRSLKLFNVEIMAHRVAFAVMTGRWPRHLIDHINGNPLDNRWCNLREATNSQNQANRSVVLSRSGILGVTWHKQSRKWQAAIKQNGKNKHLGLFDDIDEAANAYKRAALDLYGSYSSINRGIKHEETS
jgi:hypothetical protein